MNYTDMSLQQLFTAADAIFENNALYEDDDYTPEQPQVALQDSPFYLDESEPLFEEPISEYIAEYITTEYTVSKLKSLMKLCYNVVVPSKWRKAQVVDYYCQLLVHGDCAWQSAS